MGRGVVAIAGQQLGDAGARHQFARQHAVQRRQGDGAIRQDFDRGAALAEQDHRTERGIDARADDQLLRERAPHHRLDRKAGEPRLRLQPAHAGQHLVDRAAQLAFIAQVQAHAAHIGLVADVGREDFQSHRVAELAGRQDRRVGGGPGGHRRHDRNPVRLQHRLRLELVQHFAALGERGLDGGTCASEVGRSVLACRRRFQQHCLVAPVGHEHREGTHGLLGGGVVGDTRLFEDVPCIRHRGIAEPAGHHAAGRLPCDGRAFAGDVVAAHDGGRRMHEQHRAAIRIGEQRLQRLAVPLDRGVADDVDRIGARPGGRQHVVELRAQACAQFPQRDAGERRRIGRHHPGAAAVGHQRQPFVAVAPEAGERLRGHEEVLQGVHAQHASAADRGIEHDVGAGHRAGVRSGRLHAAARAARLYDDDRLVAGGGAGGRHELAGRLDRFDVEKDRAGARIARQAVEQVAEIHVGTLAEGHHVGKADAPRLRPIEHGGHECARLRYESDFPG